jgi:arabinoxylan arabinofuranohydrolase
MDDGVYNVTVKNVTGVHAVFFILEACFAGDFIEIFKVRRLFDLVSFVFMK